MKALVDTCVWSQVLRREDPDPELTAKLWDLINDSRVTIIGPIRQELLSGIPNGGQFQKLKKILASYEDIPLTTAHFEKAAEFGNLCRKKGVQGSTIDFLICAVAYIEKLAIFTIDSDFDNYAKFLPATLVK
jgi:hypothetical protein